MIPRGHPFAAPFAAVLVLIAGRTARAQQAKQFSLEWSAPSTCPDDAAVRAEVEHLLGARIESRVRDDLAVHATIALDDSGARLDLDTLENGAHGQRTIHGSTCGEVTSAGALVIALAVDPDAVREHSDRRSVAAFSTPAPVADQTPAPITPALVATPGTMLPAPLATEPPPRRAVDDRHRSLTGLLEARALLDVGTLPNPSLGVGIGAGFAAGSYRVMVGANYLLPRFAAAPTALAGPGRGADVSLLAGVLTGCEAFSGRVVAFEGCLGLEAGALIAKGEEFERATTATEPWLAGLATLDATVWSLDPVTLRADVGIAIPFGRSAIGFRDTAGVFQEIDRPSAVSARAGIGVGLAFR